MNAKTSRESLCAGDAVTKKMDTLPESKRYPFHGLNVSLFRSRKESDELQIAERLAAQLSSAESLNIEFS